MAGEIATTVFHCEYIPEGPVAYELMSTTNAVHFDASGTPGQASVSVAAFRLNGTSRTPIPVNAQGGAEHWVVLKLTASDGSVYATAKADVSASSLLTVRSARFDLIPKVKTPANYMDADVLASCPVIISRDGTDGTNGSFTSTVFVRSPQKPDAPTGGTYGSPIPTSKVTVGSEQRQWTDAPLSGTDPVWISRAIFNSSHTSDTNAPTWSDPSPAVDSNDVEFIWSADETAPVLPDSHPYDAATFSGWSKDATDAVWMAMAIKSNGAWQTWQKMRIKGEGAVYARVSPEVVEMKKGVLKYKAYVDVYDGGTLVDCNDVTYPWLMNVSPNGWIVANRLKYSFGEEGGRFYYEFSYFPSGEVNMDISLAVTYKGKSYPVTIPLRSIADGESVTGPPGVYVPPMMLWSDYDNGYEFQCGDVDNGDTRLDMVLTLNSANEYFAWKCVQTHVKGADGTLAPPVSGENNAYWERADAGIYKFLATDLLWARVGRVDFLSGQAFRVGDSDGVCGYFGVPTNGAIFFSGGSDTNNATYAVFSNGLVRCGNAYGKRIVLNPASQSLEAYDADNTLRYKLSGDTIDVNNPIPSGAGLNKNGSTLLADLYIRTEDEKTEGFYERIENYTLLSIAASEITKDGHVKVTIPLMTLFTAYNEGATDSTLVRAEYTLKVGTQYAGSHFAELSRDYVRGGGQIVSQGSTEKQVLSASVKSGDSVELTAKVTAQFFGTPNSQTVAKAHGSTNVTASVTFDGMLTQFGANGVVIALDSSNYFYALFGGGKLHIKAMSNGNQIFSS